MSLHPSLKIDTAGVQQKTVLTRIERIKDLMKKGLWSDDHTVTGLPKTKIVRIKTRKTAKEGTAEGAEGAAAPAAAGEAKPAAKGAAPAAKAAAPVAKAAAKPAGK